MKLRHRKIFTRDDRLRLRFVMPGAALCLLVGMGVSIASLSYVSLKWMEKGGQETVPAIAALDTDEAASSGDVAAAEALDPKQTLVSQGIRQAVLKLKKPKRPSFYNVKVAAGGTVAGAIQDIGISGQDAYFAVKALTEHYDPRQVKPGQAMDIHVKPLDDGSNAFEKLVFQIDPVKVVTVTKDEDGFHAALDKKKLVTKHYARTAKIQTSLYGSAAQAGIPPQIIAELIRAYSWDVDFQRDIRSGDVIKVLYDVKETEDGEFAGYGDVTYADLTVGGRAKPIFRYEMKDGRVDYFEADGRSVKKTLMKTPVNGARLSSGYGMRKHPVLGYNKMHKGLDFAAPTGTPIYAAGDGVVEYAGSKGSYGKYVRIRHNGKLKTAYAHMHKIARRMSAGTRVEQGQVIGYVGSTGRSTGPHLHYEVILNGKQVNPNRVDLPVGEALTGEEMKRFKALSAAVEQEYATLAGDYKVASSKKSQDENYQ